MNARRHIAWNVTEVPARNAELRGAGRPGKLGAGAMMEPDPDPNRPVASGRRLRALLMIFLMLAAHAASAQTKLVWPPAPAQPRIAYVQNVSAPQDLGIRPAGARRFSNWLTGAQEKQEPLTRPFGVSVDASGNLCVTDTAANVVCCFDTERKRWHRWEQIEGTRFQSPVAVVRRGDTFFVADSGLGAVIGFNLAGKRVLSIRDGIERPVGLALADNRLFVVDALRHCVAVYDLRGTLITKFGARGAGPGEFNFPTHVAAGNGVVAVTDSMNRRVQVFDANGTFKRQIGEAGDGPGSFSRPKGVAMDAAGRIYVVDAMFDNVQVFDATGRLLMDFGRGGTGAGEFWLPNGIAIGSDNRIYVADSYNSRVQIFKYIGP